MTPPVRKSLSLADGVVSYLEWASGGPLLHFAHANGFNAETYQSLLAPLAGHFHILASDARGHGFTQIATPDGFAEGWRVFGEDLLRFVEALDVGPIMLAGHSMGAVASLMAAAAAPERVHALALIEPVFLPAVEHPTIAHPQLVEGVKATQAERAAKRRDVFASAAAMEDSYRGRGAFEHWPDTMLHDYVAGGTVPTEDGQVRLACSPQVEAACFAAAPAAPWRLADNLRCKVTLLHGDQADTTCRAEEARAFAVCKPQARIVAVPGTGHFLPMQRPDIVRAEILRLMESS